MFTLRGVSEETRSGKENSILIVGAQSSSLTSHHYPFAPSPPGLSPTQSSLLIPHHFFLPQGPQGRSSNPARRDAPQTRPPRLSARDGGQAQCSFSAAILFRWCKITLRLTSILTNSSDKGPPHYPSNRVLFCS
jgi:hypothetical protein